jgi:hypothetical protein
MLEMSFELGPVEKALPIVFCGFLAMTFPLFQTREVEEFA